MTAHGRRWAAASLAVLLAAVLVALGAVVALAREDQRPLERATVGTQTHAVEQAQEFLAAYVDPDGRVVRRDQGSDTVSEGQAYAMLAAVAVDDRATFDRLWWWTSANLRRGDGLLSWRWADGSVVDEQSASDADLDAAWALALAERAWPRGTYGEEASRLAAAVEEHETATVDGQRVLAAGPWSVDGAERGNPLVVNPSYASPVAEAVLMSDGHARADRTRQRAAGTRAVLATLIEDGAPSDWALVAADGEVVAARSPGEAGGGRFGWDAVRVPLRYGASCSGPDVDLAAAIWPAIEAGAGTGQLGDHPARLVGAAAAAAAAGRHERALALLEQATANDDAHPSYYGAALDALGWLLLATDELGSCPPLAAA
jgi:endoglucanase